MRRCDYVGALRWSGALVAWYGRQSGGVRRMLGVGGVELWRKVKQRVGVFFENQGFERGFILLLTFFFNLRAIVLEIRKLLKSFLSF